MLKLTIQLFQILLLVGIATPAFAGGRKQKCADPLATGLPSLKHIRADFLRGALLPSHSSNEEVRKVMLSLQDFLRDFNRVDTNLNRTHAEAFIISAYNIGQVVNRLTQSQLFSVDSPLILAEALEFAKAFLLRADALGGTIPTNLRKPFSDSRNFLEGLVTHPPSLPSLSSTVAQSMPEEPRDALISQLSSQLRDNWVAVARIQKEISDSIHYGVNLTGGETSAFIREALDARSVPQQMEGFSREIAVLADAVVALQDYQPKLAEDFRVQIDMLIVSLDSLKPYLLPGMAPFFREEDERTLRTSLKKITDAKRSPLLY